MGTRGDGSRLYLGDAGDQKRFWSKVDTQHKSGCWVWTAGTFATGYGAFRLNGTTWLAHRLSYSWAYGHIAEHLVIDHFVCSNRKCVRPDHLKAVTQQENSGREQKRHDRSTCSTPSCESPVKSEALGICNACYRRQRRENETRVCKVDGCGGKWFSRDFCAMHYEHYKSSAEFKDRKKRNGLKQTNYWRKTAQDPETGCWIWQGQTKENYGVVNVLTPDGRYVARRAHRIIWEELRGPIPEGFVLDHAACSEKLCCNPDHLEVVTLAENTRRSSAARAGQSRRSSDHHLDLNDRIDARLSRRSGSECWIWTGSVSDIGTPILRIKLDGGKYGDRSVRKLMWRRYGRPDPKAQAILTTCIEVLCVNPAHLKLAKKADKPSRNPPRRRYARSRRRRWF